MDAFERESADMALKAINRAMVALHEAELAFLDSGLEFTAEEVSEAMRGLRRVESRTLAGLEYI